MFLLKQPGGFSLQLRLYLTALTARGGKHPLSKLKFIIFQGLTFVFGKQKKNFIYLLTDNSVPNLLPVQDLSKNKLTAHTSILAQPSTTVYPSRWQEELI